MDTEKREKKFILDEPTIRLFPDIAIGVLAVPCPVEGAVYRAYG